MITRYPRIVVAALCCLLTATTSATAEGAWVLRGGVTGREGAGTQVSGHTTLTECLREQKSWEERQRAYLRAANEASPQDRLPLPVPADSYRCLPDTVDPRGPKGK